MIRKSHRRVVTRLACGRSAATPSSGDTALPASLYAPEMIVGLGFRGWIAGYQSGDIGYWEAVWRLYASHLGAQRAQAAVGGLSEWARSVAVASRQPISVLPLDARGFGRDESLAIAMIAACQHNTCPAMRACAFALMETSLVDEVLHHAATFALTLRSLDAIVPPAWIVNANAFVDAQGATPH